MGEENVSGFHDELGAGGGLCSIGDGNVALTVNNPSLGRLTWRLGKGKETHDRPRAVSYEVMSVSVHYRRRPQLLGATLAQAVAR